MNILRRTHGISRGFTLLELLVVLLIVSLVVGLIPPLFSAAVPGARLKGSTRDLAIALREARNQAIILNRETELLLDLENGEYSVNGNTEPLPEGVKLGIKSPASTPGLQPLQHRISFYPDGSTTATRITLSRDGQGYEIAIDWLIGRVSITEKTFSAP